MKLHLPKMLTAALLAAFAVTSAYATTTKTTTYEGGTVFNGDIWTWNNANGQNVSSGNSKYTNYTTSQTYAGNTNMTSVGGADAFWKMIQFTSENAYVGNTLRFADATSSVRLNTDYAKYVWVGGIITEAGNSGTYTLGRDSDTSFYLKGNQPVNMIINSNFTFWATNAEKSAVEIGTGGTWTVANGKVLEFNVPSVVHHANQTVNINGTGTVKFTKSYTGQAGALFNVGEGATLTFAQAAQLGGTITNNGTVNFNGAVSLSDSLTGFDAEEKGQYVDHSGATATNGYYQGVTEYTLVNGNAATGLTTVTYGGQSYDVTDNKITVGSAGDTDWTTYHLRTSGASVNVGTEKGYHAELAKVIQIADTTVDLGGATLATLEGATNGAAMKLAGTGIVSALVKSGVLDMQSDASVTVPNLNVTSNMGTYSTGAGQLVIDTVTTNNSGVIEFDSATKLTTVHLTGGTVTFGGTGLHEVTTLGLSQTGTQVSTVNVEAGAELHIVGTAVAYDRDTRFSGSFSLSHWSAANVVNVAGTLISDVVVSSCDGTGTINVLEGGRLEMRDGLNRGKNNDNAITINVANGATLAAGTTYNTEQTKNSDTMVVTLADGATLEAYYKDAATQATIVKSMTLGDVTVKTGAADHTLTLSGTLTADGTIAQTGEGALVLAGTVVIDGNTSGLTEKYIGGETPENVNGFYNAAGTITVYTGDHVTIGQDAQITYGGEDVKASMVGGVYTLPETTDYSVFYVNQGTEKVSSATARQDLEVILLAGDNTTLNVDENVSSGILMAYAENTTLDIATGKTLDGTTAGFVIDGSGTYALTAGQAALGTGVSLAETWTGAVRVSNLTKTDAGSAWISNTLANNESWVEFVNFTGYDKAWASTLAPAVTANIMLTDDAAHNAAWNLTSCAAKDKYGYTMVLAGDVKGDGTFKTSGGSDGQGQTVEFRGNISGWEGAFVADASGGRMVVFSNNATVVNASIGKVGTGAFAMVVNNAATFNKAVAVDTLTVSAGASATLAADSNIGALTLAGGFNVAENATVNLGSVTVAGETTSMGGAGTAVLAAPVALNSGTLTMSGTYNIDALTYSGESVIEGGEHTGNGFATEKGSITVVNVAEETTLSAAEATVVRGGETYTGIDANGQVTLNSANYAAFYITNESETVTTAKSKEESSHVALASIHVANGATLDVDQNIDLSLISADSAGTLNIASGKTVTAGNATTTAQIAGEGTIALKSGATNLAGATMAAGWVGTAQVSGSINDIDLNHYGQAGSKVEMNGVSGYFLKSGNAVFAPELVLSGTGLTLNNGYSDLGGQNPKPPTKYTFAGGVSGEGSMTFNKTTQGTVTQHLYFTGDVSGWTGSLSVVAGFTVYAQYSGEQTVNSIISRTGGTLNVEVGTGSDASVVTYTKAITADKLDVLAGATANINGGLTANTITVGEGGSLTMNGGTLATAITSSGSVTLTGVTLDSTVFTEQTGIGAGISKYDITGALNSGAANYYAGTKTYLEVVSEGGSGSNLTWDTHTGLSMVDGRVITGEGARIADTFYVTADTVLYSSLLEGTENVEVSGGKFWIDQEASNINIHVSGDGVIAGYVEPEQVKEAKIEQGATATFEGVTTLDPGETNTHVTITSDTSEKVAITNVGETDEAISYEGLGQAAAKVTADAVEVQAEREADVTIANALEVQSITNNSEHTLYLDGEVVTGALNAAAGDITLHNVAEPVVVGSLTIGDNVAVGAYQGTDEEALQEATVVISQTLTAGEESVLHANLELKNGATLNFTGTLTMTSELDVEGTLALDETSALYQELAGFAEGSGRWVDLIMAADGSNLAYTNPGLHGANAADVFTNTLFANGDYMVFATEKSFGITRVPEPTTGTLSLLALAALAARRRKH